MRDPRVGAVGASVAVAAVLLRLAWVAALLGAGLWLRSAVPACGRGAMVVSWLAGPAEGASLAAALAHAASPGVAGGALLLTAAGAGRGHGAAALAGLAPWAAARLRARWPPARSPSPGSAPARRRFGDGGRRRRRRGGAGRAGVLAVLALLTLPATR